ncbi:hypothetical protein A3K01_04060 [candidate division WWE3 bacterium RIFOXYD1_FULL_43_17]|uniref:Uncharacterized protein n=3 Tax=Katanobacteria TaxID=422282 RepID=A0A1F4XDZ6_UNCKA|nr:MAG: hypothetical protein UU59_C0028G0006 [candidate division WWE3 bacterium GW2011_GWE1_41_27]KKS60055.1 MAG: hypothetical protein UV26_C0010G0008 [candidate division WWE3 bacterium GW2011_GWF2_42_42]OGC79872.1 MAG: hypothetical protein A3K01_04060 [candidate division WWE3 bacterium RIFOXYD1_FULL_43_17]
MQDEERVITGLVRARKLAVQFAAAKYNVLERYIYVIQNQEVRGAKFSEISHSVLLDVIMHNGNVERHLIAVDDLKDPKTHEDRVVIIY